MSAIDSQGHKVLLPRLGPNEIWTVLAQEYAGKDRRRWKRLAVIALHDALGWPLSYLTHVFGHTKGHLSRLVNETEEELRERFADGRASVKPSGRPAEAQRDAHPRRRRRRKKRKKRRPVPSTR